LRNALQSEDLIAGRLEDHDGLRFRMENWDCLHGEEPHPAEKLFTSHGSCISRFNRQCFPTFPFKKIAMLGFLLSLKLIYSYFQKKSSEQKIKLSVKQTIFKSTLFLFT